MKKALSLLLGIILIFNMSPLVFAQSDNLVFELDLTDMSDGPLQTNTMNVIEDSVVNVATDGATGEKYVEIWDKHPSKQVGLVAKNIDLRDTTTISFKTLVCSDTASNSGPELYLYGNSIYLSVFFSPEPFYYTGTESIKPGGQMQKERWTLIECIVNGSEGVFSLYIDGVLLVDGANLRGDKTISEKVDVTVTGNSTKNVHCRVKDFKIYSGKVLEDVSEKYPDIVKPERTLVDYSESAGLLNNALENAVAMSVGNSVARVNNRYVNMAADDKYAAPVVSENGTVMIPACFADSVAACSAELISETVCRFSKNGIVAEFTAGDKNAVVNGKAQQLTSAPEVKNGKLYIPLGFVSEIFGRQVFADERGLIVVSDKAVIEPGQENIIKPLMADIRNHTTVSGNEKYSDVSFSFRRLRPDGHTTGTTKKQWGSIDASKRFMATSNLWSYEVSGNNNKIIRDLGFLNQGTLNGAYMDVTDFVQSTYFFDGTPYTRSDGAMGTGWGCVNDPLFYEHLLGRAKQGIDNGMFTWQFDDWAMNDGYTEGGCFCDNCMKGFTDYIINVANPKTVAKTGISDFTDFNYKTYLQNMGITQNTETLTHSNSALRELMESFQKYSVISFHTRLKKDMEEYAGSKIYYSINSGNSLANYISNSTYGYINNYVDGKMGETSGGYTTAAAIYTDMLFGRAQGLKDVISPLPKSDADKLNMYAGIAMCYASGMQMLIPWDDYLSSSLRYYATLEELGHVYELPREYPYLFDNYEIPERIGYVYNLDKISGMVSVGEELLEKSIPARVIVSRQTGGKYNITADKLKGLEAIVADDDMLAGITQADRDAIAASGIPVISPAGAEIAELEKTTRMVRSYNENITTVLRKNMLYDNAPTVVHAVNYSKLAQENTEIEINNIYLPDGEELTVNVYRPGKNPETIVVKKGSDFTRLNIGKTERWAVLEICGATTVCHDDRFDIGNEYNGIGMGTRLSYDSAKGTPDSFTITTYGEGINSTTYGDTTGCQDEIAYVYKRLGTGIVSDAYIQAGFDGSDGAYGVMAREGIYSNARFVALMYDSENGLRLAKRLVTNKGTIYTKLGDTKPKYMKLQRDGRVYYAYISDNGADFEKVGAAEIEFSETVGGVFAASSDGSREVCGVTDFCVDYGSSNGEKFKEFTISYGNGTIENYTYGEKLNISLSTENHENLTLEDVDISFTSSNENVLRVNDEGIITPVGTGTATIEATASMGEESITAVCDITVLPVNHIMFEENFDGNAVPSYMKSNNSATEVSEGICKVKTAVSGAESDLTFNINLRNHPTVYEFDFRANFDSTPSTGARVLYASNSAVSLTASKNGFSWFYGASNEKVASITENKWYHIKIEVDYDTQKANVYIDGKKVVDNAEGRSGFSTDGKIQIGGWRLGTGTCYEWDNFKCYFVVDIHTDAEASVSKSGAVLKYKFSEEPESELTAEDFSVSSDKAVISSVTTNGKECMAVVENLDSNTEYSVLLKRTFNTQRLNKEFTFTTGKYEEIQLVSLGGNKCTGKAVRDCDNLTLYLTGDSFTAYCAAASYNTDGSIKDIKFKTLPVTEKNISEISFNVNDTDRIYIWNTQITPIFEMLEIK